MAFLKGGGWLSNGLAVVSHFTPVVMTRCLDGGTLFNKKRLVRGPAIIFLLLIALFLTACGSRVANNNWPGMTSDGDTVYVSYGPGVAAFDVNEQQQLWFFSPEGGGQSLQIFAPPSVMDGRVAFGDYGQSGGFISPNVTVTIYMLDEDDVRVPVWTQSQVAQDRIVAQALQVGDRLYVGTADNFMVAMDSVKGGTPLWDDPFEAGHSIWGQAAYEDGILYVPSLDKSVHALEAETGAIIWQTDVGGSVSDKPILNGDLVYVGSFDQQLHALDKTTGASRWTVPAEASVWGAPALDEDTVYFVDLNGTAYAVDAQSGEVRWQQAYGDYVVAAPVIYDGVLYIATGGDPDLDPGDRNGAVIALDASSGEEIWQKITPVPVYTTPALVDDKLVVAMQSSEEPLTLWTIDTNDPDRTAIMVPENVVEE